ncbi:substrate-binding domain-containing protein [Sphaerimonospora sp. CA-214678]|uniref:substrate-binding domain-containing protein n=1 Tax=Sphaerimonospora sp. CA-214678 TaxID=3240029 RepID=UPI003D8E3710
MRLKTGLLSSLMVVTALVVSACASAGTDSDGDAGTASKTAATSDVRIEFVTHGGAGDDFWDAVKTGAAEAGTDLGIRVNYQSDDDASKQSQLIDTAVASKPSGLVVSLANPDGVRDAIDRAVAAGIPVIVTNKGAEQWKEFGAQTYVGQSEIVSGREAGARLTALNLKNVLCIVHEVGNIGNQQRCQGIKEGVNGTVTHIQVDGADLAGAQNLIKSALLADPTVDGVVSLNTGINTAAAGAIAEADSSAKLAGFEVTDDTLRLIGEGKMLFTVDQQPYLQGYLPVVFLDLHLRHGFVVGGEQPVYTGPGFITPDNVARYMTNGQDTK